MPRAISLLSVRESESGKHQKLYLSAPIEVPGKQTDPKKDRQSYVVTTALYLEIGAPKKSATLPPDVLLAIAHDDERFRATRQAMRFLAYADNSEATLVRKLRAKGYSREAAEEAAREMVTEGFLDEKDQLARKIADEVNLRHTGPRKLLPKLAAKGFRKDDIENALRSLESEGVIDFDRARRELVTKELPKIKAAYPTEEEQKDAIRKLLFKNGWSASIR